MLNLLKILLSEQQENLKISQKSVPRDIQFPELTNKIKVAIGMRRVGKTYLLLQEIQRLQIEKNIPTERFLYLNFEDDRLLPCSEEKLRQLLEAFYQLYPQNHHELCYLFLDEIQNVQNWSLVIRRFFDTKKVQIYLSGSSAKLLSKEIATELRGRSFAIEVWPFSFHESLIANQVKFSGNILGQSNRDLLLAELRKYLNHGGFPETTSLKTVEARQILQDYVELVIMRDIVERHKIKNTTIIKYLIQTLLKNTACNFSVNKFFNDAKSQGLSVSRHLLYEYLEHITDAYLICPVPLFTESLRKTQVNPKKMYSIDPGLVKAYTFSLNDNFGHLFENMFFLDLKRLGHKIYYYHTQNGYEVDFLTEDRLGVRKLYQVVWDTSDTKTWEREERALNIAMQELKIEGEIITPNSYIEKIWGTLF